MLPKLILNNCTINVYVNPQGIKTEIKPNDPAIASQTLQLEKKEPIWLSAKEASELFGLSVSFFQQLVKKHPELGDIDLEKYRSDKSPMSCRTWINQEAAREYLEANPHHKLHSLAMKRQVNIPMLAERGYRILQEEHLELYPDTSRVPTARRNRYLSYAEMARRLGITPHYYWKHIRLPLNQKIKENPDKTDLKRRQDEEMARCVRSWGEVSKRDRKLRR